MNEYKVEFYSDFSQLKYVFAEVVVKKEIPQAEENITDNNDKANNPLDAKLKILEDEKNIIEESNKKFQEENENLKNEINSLNFKVIDLNSKISSQERTISEFNLDRNELKFLRLNLEYGHKCRKSFLNNKGFTVGSEEYKNCVLNKGKN